MVGAVPNHRTATGVGCPGDGRPDIADAFDHRPVGDSFGCWPMCLRRQGHTWDASEYGQQKYKRKELLHAVPPEWEVRICLTSKTVRCSIGRPCGLANTRD